ncbi:hypothetical protein [Rhodopirellula baltica]
MSLSIRELLMLPTFVGLALAGVMFGPPISWVALIMVIMLLNAIAIDAFVASPRRRSFAIGFLLSSLVYLGTTIAVGSTEYAARGGILPTTELLQYMLRPAYVFGISPHSDLALRQANALSVMPLGQLFFACVFGYLGGWYARLASRSSDAK